MKIALLSFEYPPETGFGGIGTYTWYHARALARMGHEVHVLAGATKPTRLRRDTHDGVVVHRFRAGGRLQDICLRPLGLAGMWWTKNRLENGWSMLLGFKQLLREQSFDVVEMPECGAEGWLINHFCGVPSIIRFHSPAKLIMESYDAPSRDIRWCSRLEDLAMRGAGAFSSCSRFLADEVRTKIGLAAPIEVIYNGIDLGLFDADDHVDVRNAYGLPAGQPIVLFTGRIEARKGIEICPAVVASILERYPVSFVFAGRDLFGYMREVLQPSVAGRRLRGSLHYLGEVDFRSVRSCLRQADVFFLPSLWENCPYSVIEAMAAGRAIVCSNQGGMPELIRHEENGLLAATGDPASFVAQIERLLDDRALRDRLGTAARRTVETSLTDMQIAERSVAFYRTVVEAA